MVITISNYAGTSDTFTFQHNPQVFDDTLDTNYNIKQIPFERRHILVSGAGIAPKTLILTGHFNGSTKLSTYYRGLAKHVSENHKLKKLYWETDKFYLCVGKQIKQTNSGGRTNFIDYVCSFETIVGYLFGNTLRTSGTNAGNITTVLEELTGTVTNGANPITISDGLGNVITIPASALTTSQNIIFMFVDMIDSGSGVYVSEYNYFGLGVDSGTTDGTTANKLVQSGQNFLTTVAVNDLVVNTTDSTKAKVTAVDNDTTLSISEDIMVSGEAFIIYRQSLTVQTTSGTGIIQLESGANITTVTTTNITSAVKKFRDGYIA